MQICRELTLNNVLLIICCFIWLCYLVSVYLSESCLRACIPPAFSMLSASLYCFNHTLFNTERKCDLMTCCNAADHTVNSQYKPPHCHTIYIITLVSPLFVCLCVCVLPNSSETVGRIDFIFGHDIDPIPGMILIYFS